MHDEASPSGCVWLSCSRTVLAAVLVLFSPPKRDASTAPNSIRTLSQQHRASYIDLRCARRVRSYYYYRTRLQMYTNLHPVTHTQQPASHVIVIVAVAWRPRVFISNTVCAQCATVFADHLYVTGERWRDGEMARCLVIAVHLLSVSQRNRRYAVDCRPSATTKAVNSGNWTRALNIYNRYRSVRVAREQF